MLKHILLLLFGVLFFVQNKAQEIGDLYKIRDGGRTLNIDYDGGFMIDERELYQHYSENIAKVVLSKFSRGLELLYKRRLYVGNYGTTAFYFGVNEIKPLSNGEILIGGQVYRDSWGINHYFTLKLDVNGNLAWFRRFASIEYMSNIFYNFHIDVSDEDYFYYTAYYFISDNIEDELSYQDRDVFLVKARLSDGLTVSRIPLDVYKDIGCIDYRFAESYTDRFNTDEFYLDRSLYPLPWGTLTHGFFKFNTSGEVLQSHHIGYSDVYDSLPYIPYNPDTVNFYVVGGDMAQLPSGNTIHIGNVKGDIEPDSSWFGLDDIFVKLSAEGDLKEIKPISTLGKYYYYPIETCLYGDSLWFVGGRKEKVYNDDVWDEYPPYKKLGILKLDTNGNTLDSLELPPLRGYVISDMYGDSTGLYIIYTGTETGNYHPDSTYNYFVRINPQTMEIDTFKASDFGHSYHYLSDSTYNTDDIVIPVTNVMGIPDVLDNPNVGLYPNPAQDMIQWSIKDVHHISINNVTGQVLVNKPMTGHSLDVSFLPNGSYTIIFTCSNQQQVVSKFVIKR